MCTHSICVSVSVDEVIEQVLSSSATLLLPNLICTNSPNLLHISKRVPIIFHIYSSHAPSPYPRQSQNASWPPPPLPPGPWWFCHTHLSGSLSRLGGVGVVVVDMVESRRGETAGVLRVVGTSGAVGVDRGRRPVGAAAVLGALILFTAQWICRVLGTKVNQLCERQYPFVGCFYVAPVQTTHKSFLIQQDPNDPVTQQNIVCTENQPHILKKKYYLPTRDECDKPQQWGSLRTEPSTPESKTLSCSWLVHCLH